MTTRAPKVTAHPETAALYALLQDDQDELARIIDGMLPSERRGFEQQLQRLSDELGMPCVSCYTPTPERKVPETAGHSHLCETCAAPEPQKSRQSA